MAQPPVNVCSVISPAQLEEERLLLLYEMRDRLMRDHGLSELQATASVTAFSAVAIRVEPREVVAMIRHLRRIERQRRDQAIRAELRTGNAEDVGRRHGVSVRRAYEIAGETN